MTSWTFVHVTDNHLGTPRSYRFRPAINKRWFGIRNQIVASNADLMLHSGDLTRDGATHEYEYQLARNELDMLPFPTFVVPGNMDVGNKHANSPGTQQWDDRDLNMKSSRLNLFASYFGPVGGHFCTRRCGSQDSALRLPAAVFHKKNDCGICWRTFPIYPGVVIMSP